jgi:hypothetical protein
VRQQEIVHIIENFVDNLLLPPYDLFYVFVLVNVKVDVLESVVQHENAQVEGIISCP